MTLANEFETLKNEAQMRGLLQTDIFYRVSDGQPSIKKRVKFIDGQLQEVAETKPIKSVHFIRFADGLVLRVKRSKKERKGNLQAVLDLAEQLELMEALQVLRKVSGEEKGKNVEWSLDCASCTFVSIAAYLKEMKVDATVTPSVYVDRPAIQDDLVLLSGWQ